MNDTVDFVITNENWDKNFDEVRMIIDQLWLLLDFDTVKLTRLTSRGFEQRRWRRRGRRPVKMNLYFTSEVCNYLVCLVRQRLKIFTQVKCAKYDRV